MNHLKFTRILKIVVIFMLLTGCAAPTATIPTQAVNTAAFIPAMTASPIPTHTPTSSPTATAVPTYTPTPIDVPLTATAIAAGNDHTCAVTSRGGVMCWGNNWAGQLGDGTTTTQLTPVNVLGLTSDVVAVSGGRGHTCVLMMDGSVKCWGDNSRGQLGDGTSTNRLTPVEVVGLTGGVIAIDAGEWHTCAVTTQGGVKCWGSNYAGELGDGTTIDHLVPVDVVGLTNGIKTIQAGVSHTCVLTNSGGVKCWGANNVGQLGDGTTTNRLTPINVVGLTREVIVINVGGRWYSDCTCALTKSGGIKCWGSNRSGQLGDRTTEQRLTPVDVVGLTSAVTAVAVGSSHTCALTARGGVKCWGANDEGQLGDNTIEQRITPVQVEGLNSGAISIATGASHTCVLTTLGRVKCWGSNDSGQLGDGSGKAWLAPGEVLGLGSGVTNIDAGESHTCALVQGGGIKCWGSGRDGDNTSMLIPVDLEGFTSGVSLVSTSGESTCYDGFCDCNGDTCVLSMNSGVTCLECSSDHWFDIYGLASDLTVISVGWEHACALTKSDGVKCWGSNTRGQMGDGTTIYRQLPVDVVGLTSGVSAISSGWLHTCALTTSGDVKCWGDNEYGQLGDGTTENAPAPVDVIGLSSGVIAISGGVWHTCAVMEGGGVKCWGNNYRGQLGDGTTEQRLTPVDVVGLSERITSISTGRYHTCALTTSGGIQCWGSNMHGELGDGTTSNSLVPVYVMELTNEVVEVTAGAYHTCALTIMGGVLCWGSNLHGTLGSGTAAIQVTPVEVVGFGP